MEISVIVPSQERKDLLEKTLYALCNQETNIKYEILIVYYQNKEIKTFLKNFKKKYDFIKFFPTTSKSLTNKRDLGLSKANGKIIAFCDDDCIPQKNWLQNIVNAFENNPAVLGVEGKIITDEKSPIFSNAPKNIEGKKFVGCNTHYRKKALEMIGGFDEEFPFWREDSRTAFQILEKGKIIFEPNILIYHPPRKISPGRLLNNLNNIYFDLKLFKLHSKKYLAYFGFPLIKNFTESFFTYLCVLISLFGSIFYFPLLLCGILIYLWRYPFYLRNKIFTFWEIVILIFLTTLKDLLFPLYFTYYFFSVLFVP